MLIDNIKCFRCNQYGHRAVNYKVNIRPKILYIGRNAYAFQIEYDVRYFKYHNHGHITRFYISTSTSNR